jgi:hypothetical protein
LIGAIIVDRKKNRFINAAGLKRFTYKRNIESAMVYDEWTAKNIVSSNLPKELKKTAEVILVEQDEKTGTLLKIYDPQNKIRADNAKAMMDNGTGKKHRNQIQLHGYRGSDCAALMRDTSDKLSEMLSEVDREISDIYHFLIEHKRLPANKAIQIFYMWYDVLLRRAEVKRYIAALKSGLNPQIYRYVPRTDLYEKLEKMIDVEPKQEIRQ